MWGLRKTCSVQGLAPYEKPARGEGDEEKGIKVKLVASVGLDVLEPLQGTGLLQLRFPGFRPLHRQPSPPEWIAAHIQALRGNLGVLAGSAAVDPQLTAVRYRTDDLEDIDNYLAELAQGERRLLPLILGAQTTYRRLAVGLAAWANPEAPIIETEHLVWVVEYVRGHLGRFLERFRVISSDDGKLDTYQRVLEAIGDSGVEGVTVRNLAKYVWAFRNLSGEQRQEIIDRLLADEEIEEVKKGRATILVAKRFTREVPKHGE